MASRGRWLRRSADDEGDKPADQDAERGARVGEPPAAPVAPSAPAGPVESAGPAGPMDEPARTPLVQARLDRLVAAAGIEPARDLSDHARSVLDWLARQDDATCSGVVELLQATSLAAIRHG